MYSVYRMRVERPTLIREAVYDRLKSAIVEGELAPGARMLEVELAEKLGVSRTPVREALLRLAQEGLAELLPGRGARVRVLSPAEVAEVYEVRAALEAEAARLAALRASGGELEELAQLEAALHEIPRADLAAQTRADARFHARLVALSKNRELERLFHQLDAKLALARRFSADENQSPKTLAEHRAIVEALKSRNPEAAAQAARAHIERFKALVASRLAEALEVAP